MKILFLTFILFISCGEKKAADPIKVQVESAGLQMSPSGISQIQKVFDIYSSDGKLSVEEMQNITNRISPEFSKNLNQLNLKLSHKKKFSASELFLFLGESNKAVHWSLSHDLQTQTGWNEVLKEEFSWADEGLLNESKNLTGQLLTDPEFSKDQNLYSTQVLKIGGAFSFLDAVDPTTGSTLDAITKRIIFNSSQEKRPELSYETLRLAKFVFLLKYTLLERGSNEKENISNDRFAKWSLSSTEEIIAQRYPGLTTENLSQLLYETTATSIKKAKKNNSYTDLHHTLHSKAYKILGEGKFDKEEILGAYDLYQVVRSTCKKNKLPKKLSDWIMTFDSKFSGLNYTDQSFCEEIKDTDSQNHGAE